MHASRSLSKGTICGPMENRQWILGSIIGILVLLMSCNEDENSPMQSSADLMVFAGSYDKNFYAFDAVTGEIKWKFTTGEKINSTPSINNNIVYFGSNDGHLYAL